jgi:tetratricopeptide (TPR) repeat protein
MSEVGAKKYEFCKKLGSSFNDLADYFDIKQRAGWGKGRECWSILEWLEERDRLHELQEALVVVDREDLLDLIQGFQSSNPLNDFFEVPPAEIEKFLNRDDIAAFFRGYSDSWTPVQAGIALPRRLKPASGESFYLNEFVEKLLSNSAFQFVKIFGAGGSGKTTFARMLALTLAQHQSSSTVFLRNLEQQQIPKNEIQRIAQKFNTDSKKLFLIYDNPIRSSQVSEVLILVNALRNIRNIVIVVLEREDEWLAAYEQARGRSQRGEQNYYLEEQLRSDEIDQLCQVIEKLQSERPNDYILSGGRNVNDFRQSLIQGSQNVLLVAMYEATTGEKIEEIIINEFSGIPNENAKKLYEAICGFIFYDIQFPYDLARILYGMNDLKNIKQKHLAGIIHQSGGLLFPRHKTIAEILWLERNLETEIEMQTFAEFLLGIKYAGGISVGTTLDEFSLQVFKLLTTHPKLQPEALPYLSDIVDALSDVTEYQSAANLYLQAGQYFEQKSDRIKAITQYQRGIQKYPHSQLFILLSKALMKQGDSKKAIDVLREGINKAPYQDVYIVLSQALLRQEDGLNEAIDVLREGINKAPYHGVYIALSQALLRQEDGLSEAITVLREGINKAPDHDVYIALSQALLRQEDGLNKAIDVLREGINKAPYHGVYIALSQALLCQEDGLNEAITVLREGINKAPNQGVYIALNQALLSQEDGLDEAIALLQEGIQKNPCRELDIALTKLLQDREQ